MVVAVAWLRMIHADVVQQEAHREVALVSKRGLCKTRENSNFSKKAKS